MSETPGDETRKVQMAKSAKTAEPGGAPPARGGFGSRRPTNVPVIPVVATINAAHAFLGLMVLGLWARTLGLLGNDAQLQKYYTDSNNKAKKPDKNFNAIDTVHQARTGALITGVVITIAVAILIVAMRRTRTASATRWGLLIILVLTSLPFSIIPQSGLPTLFQVGSVLTGVGSIAAIVLCFVPQSSKYFRDCRAALLPEGVEPRPSAFGSLFRPRPPVVRSAPRGGRAGGPATRPAATRPAGAAGKSSSSKAKAKVRSDSDAVAKGAELARARAKTNKTRR